jgi:hypothetical protein
MVGSKTKLKDKITETRIKKIKERQAKIDKSLGPTSIFPANIFSRGNSKFLARENLLTLLFIERLRRQTKRNIIVVPIGKTGEPYTWGIEAIKPAGVKLSKMIEYPSSERRKSVYEQGLKNLLSILEKSGKRSIMVCVDSSMSRRMPSSFMGYPGKLGGFTSPENSIKNSLEREGYTVIPIGYDYSKIKNFFRRSKTKSAVDKLPRNLKLKDRTVILLNPSKERKVHLSVNGFPWKQRWNPAFHDDKTSALPPNFKEHVQNQVRLAKKQ